MYAFQNEYCYIKGAVAYTNTKIIAEKAGRKHKSVLRDLSDKELLRDFLTGHNIVPSEFKDSTGRALLMYELTEQQALTILPFIGGRKSFEIQEQVVGSFMEARQFISEIAVGDWQDDPMALMQRAYNIVADREVKKTKEQLTVTQLAVLYNKKTGKRIKATDINIMLTARGLQKVHITDSKRYYTLTSAGEKYGAKVGSQSSPPAIRWIDSVLNLI